MDAATLVNNYPWYLSAHIALWRESGGRGVEPITELVVLNHPEAVVECEEVDIDLLMEFVDEPIEQNGVSHKSQPVAMDAIASLKMMEPRELKKSASRDLIDKFLEVKELRIVAEDECEEQEPEVVWEQADDHRPYTAEEVLASEELARIYLNQKLYSEASDIYNRLFLLYSEKSVYFATQIENIAKILEDSDKNQLGR